MKIRKSQNFTRAGKVFTDREEPRGAFWNAYEQKTAAVDDVRVLTYYGIGGIGKTSLLKQLISEMEEKIARPRYVCADFNVRQEMRGVLEGMRNSLSRNYQFSFPVFDIAMYIYSKKIGEKVQENNAQGFIEKSSALTLLFNALGMVPAVGLVSRMVTLADRGSGVIKNIISNRRRELSEIDAEPVETVYRRLPYYFAQDLAENLLSLPEPLVVFFDTYEMLVNEMSGAGEPMNNDLWIRGGEGLIQNVPNVLWVIAGREKMKWAHFSREWEEALEQHLLGSLSEHDVKYFFKSAGIFDEKLIQSLCRLTNGTPVFLDLCADTYHALQDQGKTPALDDFGDTLVSLVERYVRYMDDGKKDVVYFLSCLRVWNDKIFSAAASSVIPNYSFTTYEKIKGLSFVISQDENFYYIHETVRGILHRCCPAFIKEKAEAAIRRYYEEELSAVSVTDVGFEPVFSLYIQYTLPSIDSAEGFADFYGKLKPKLDLIDASCQFGFLCGQMAVLSDFADALPPQAEPSWTEPSRTEVRAQVHRDYSRYLIDAGKYAQALDSAQKAYELCGGGEPAIDAMNLMSQSRGLLGEHAEACALIAKAHRLAVNCLGEEHPLTADCMNRMANRLIALGEHEKALECNRRALAVRQKIFGSDSPEALNTLETTAAIYSRLGRYDEAAEINARVVDERRRLLGDKHPHTLSAMNNLAYRYVQMKSFGLALPLAELAVKLHREIFGDDHVSLAPVLDTLSECCSGLGEHARAVSLQESAHKIYLDTLGPAHKKTIDALDALEKRKKRRNANI